MRPLAWIALLAGIGGLNACATPQPLPSYDFGPQSAVCAEAKAGGQHVYSCDSSMLPPMDRPEAVRSYRMLITPTGYVLEAPVSLRVDAHADGSGTIYWSPKGSGVPMIRPPKGAWTVKAPRRLRPDALLSADEVAAFERAFVAGNYAAMPRFDTSNRHCLDGHEHVLEWSRTGEYRALVRASCISDLPWGLFYNLAVAKGLAPPGK